MWDLSSLTRDWTMPPAIARHILNHWTTREVPTGIIKIIQLFLEVTWVTLLQNQFEHCVLWLKLTSNVLLCAESSFILHHAFICKLVKYNRGSDSKLLHIMLLFTLVSHPFLLWKLSTRIKYNCHLLNAFYSVHMELGTPNKYDVGNIIVFYIRRN